jgi:DNA ligase D-like protein (predicted 3'-phosphoesterase)
MAGDDEDRLARYKEKRDFRRTKEPGGMIDESRNDQAERPRFVIQHHAARRDHYDFRLEVDGVLKSWAVPKGPSTDPREKRLAVPTEDHPLEYRDFEGVIAKGEYGGGAVLVWDRGTYRNTTTDHGREVAMDEALRRGHATFWLDGEKLTGGYALTRFRTGKDEAWLLVKQKDDAASARENPVRTRPESVLTGRDLAEVAAQDGGDDQSARHG